MKIVGVTACTIGVAHTYMAQEALKKEGEKRGYDIKIETQGTIGIENELTQDEIDAADVVIMAVAVCIEGEERFEDKKIVEANISDVVSHPERVMDAAEQLVNH